MTLREALTPDSMAYGYLLGAFFTTWGWQGFGAAVWTVFVVAIGFVLGALIVYGLDNVINTVKESRAKAKQAKS